MTDTEKLKRLEAFGNYLSEGSPIWDIDECREVFTWALQKLTEVVRDEPHKVSEVICVKCGKRWIAVRPEVTLLKQLECENCGCGYVIETGEIME